MNLYAINASGMITRKPWTYGNAIKNRDYLNENQAFDGLVDELCDALASIAQSQIHFQMEPIDGQYSGDDPLLKTLKCSRPSWHIPMNRELLDKFFNGRMGIRAQYYKSPYHGQLMNGRLLEKVQDRLLELAQALDSSIDVDLLRKSLSASSAKVWISETDLADNKIIRASDLTLIENELQNDWLDLARKVKSHEIATEQYQLYSAAIGMLPIF